MMHSRPQPPEEAPLRRTAGVMTPRAHDFPHLLDDGKGMLLFGECAAFFGILLGAWSVYMVFLYPSILAMDELPRLIAGGVCRFSAFVLYPLAWIAFLQRRDPWASLKLSRPFAGLAWGLGAGMILLVFALIRAEFVMPTGIKPLFPSGFVLLSAVGIAPFCEEVLFRGFFLQRLAERLNFWIANLLSATAFVIIHFPGWVLIEQTGILPFRFLTIFDILLLGLISGWLLRRSGTLWACVTLHAINNLLSLVLFS